MATTIQNIELPKKPRARDTSGNNNHGKIYSGRGLEFDGVTDYIHTPLDGNTAVFGNQSDFEVTISFWYNTSAASSDTRGVIQWARTSVVDGSPFILFKQNNNGVLRYFLDSTYHTLSHVFQDEVWYRIVLTRTASDNTWRSYVNGIADTVYDDSGSPNLQANADSVFFGTGYGGYFAGMLSDAQIWNKPFTQADVTYDYLNPESLALNASGSALTEGNLKLWYPMQDGHRGQQSYILDGANTGAGDEMVTNGDFSDGSTGWTTNNTSAGTHEVTFDSKGARFLAGATGTVMTLTSSAVVETGKNYRLEVVVSNYNGSSGVKIDSGLLSSTLTFTGNGTHVYQVSTTSSGQLITFYRNGSNVDLVIESVSLKPINDKHHATTVFTGDDLWDLADNHTANWSTTGGATKAAIGGTTDGVKLTFGGTATNENGSYIWLKDTTTNTLTEDLTVGRTYKLSGKFATDVAGATNAPRILVYASGNNYPSTATVPATNLVLNPGFETAGGGGADIWANWTEAAGSGTLANATSGMHNGADCASLTTVSGNLCNILQQINVVAETTYLASYWSKNTNASAAGDVRHRVLNTSDGDSNIVAAVNSGSETASWVQTYFQFTTPVGCTVIKYGVISPSGNYEAFVDDFMLTAFVDREITFTATHATENNFYHFNCDYVAANEMISQVDNVNSILDGTPDWQAHAASGGSAAVSYDATEDEITFTTSTNTAVEGMKLTYSNYSSLEVGRSYTILITMRAASGTPTVRVYLGASAAVTAAITTSDVTYAFAVTPVNIGGSLFITLADTSGIDITVSKVEIFPHCNLFVDDISFKEVGVASGWTDADQQLHIPQTALQSYNELAWFDGTIASDGYVDLDSAITTSGNSWSLSFWVFHDDNGQAFDIILGDGANQFIALGKDSDDKLQYRDSSNVYHAISDAAIPESEWVHITITATANTSITAYVNGVAQTTNSDMTNTTLLLERFMRGFSSASYQTFGTINEISYYNDVLTATEVLDLFNDGKAKSALEASGSAGLVGYWRNNGLSEWKDLKGSNDGNTSAGVVETILIPEGVDTTRDSQGFLMNKKRSTSSLNFPSRPQSSTEVPDFGDLDFGTGDFSMECWVQYGFINNSTFGGTASGLNVILSTGSASSTNSEGISLLSTSTDFKFRIGDGDKEDSLDIDPDPLTVGNWYHIVVTREGTALIAYVDGDANNNMTITSGINVSRSEPLRIGNDRLESRTYKWPIDAVKFYNAALSASEVLQNYNATKRDHTN